jgi:rhodanese-related sulfurtransferase
VLKSLAHIRIVTVTAMMMFFAMPAFSQETAFDTFLNRFDYEVRDDMKIDSKELIRLLRAGKGVLVDIRFHEEVAAWHTGFAMTIPINELPKRLKELPRDKVIVAACPHKDRSAIAMAYLRTMGYNARYLTDGLLGLAEYLRGERAKDFMEDIAKTNKATRNTNNMKEDQR